MAHKEKRTLISDLSQSRLFLQGMGILWVITFHLLPHLRILGGGRKDILLRAVFGAGYGGCDVFLLLSGFGLAVSLQRDGNPLRFYGRRLRKLMPAYYLFMIPFFLLLSRRGGLGWTAVVGNLTFTGFWFRWIWQFNWYVQAIMAFYLIAPLVHWVFERVRSRTLALGILLGISAVANWAWFGRYQMIAVTRLPVFLVGFWLGRHDRREIPWRFWHILGAVAMCICGAAALYWVQPYITDENGLSWYPFLLLAPGLCLLGAWARPWLLKIPGYSYIDKLICLFGTCSFEIYLIQSILIEWVVPPLSGRLQWYLLAAVAIVLGIAYHFLLDLAIKRICKK